MKDGMGSSIVRFSRVNVLKDSLRLKVWSLILSKGLKRFRLSVLDVLNKVNCRMTTTVLNPLAERQNIELVAERSSTYIFSESADEVEQEEIDNDNLDTTLEDVDSSDNEVGIGKRGRPADTVETLRQKSCFRCKEISVLQQQITLLQNELTAIKDKPIAQ